MPRDQAPPLGVVLSNVTTTIITVDDLDATDQLLATPGAEIIAPTTMVDAVRSHDAVRLPEKANPQACA